MQARIVDAASGARWLADGWRLFRRSPLGWMVAVFTSWLALTLVSLVPVAGIAAAAVLVPAFSVGFMALARSAERGGAVELASLFDGFRHDSRAQLVLGAAYFGCVALVVGASALADDGALARWLISGRRPSDEVLQSDAFLAALVCAGLAYAPVMLAFWFAPPLAAWHSTGPAKALFFSFAACMMNWRAFMVYGLAAAVVSIGLPLVVAAVVAFAGGAAGAVPAMSILFALMLILMPTLLASFYASYRDVFGYHFRE